MQILVNCHPFPTSLGILPLEIINMYTYHALFLVEANASGREQQCVSVHDGSWGTGLPQVPRHARDI